MPDANDKPHLSPLFNLDTLIPLIESDTTIITPNNRLASKISQAWGLHCLAQGKKVWRAPNVVAIDHWLDSNWLQLQNDAWPESLAVTLSSQQELLVWEQVIAADPDKPALLNAAGLATTAQRAWRTMQLWNLPASTLANDNEAGAQLLQRWINAFVDKTKRISSITRAEQITRIYRAFVETQLSKVEQVLLLGFQTLAPLHKSLLECACDAITTHTFTKVGHSPARQICAGSGKQEIEFAARWAYSKIVADATVRVGIIAPELAGQRTSIERIFREQFEADYHLPQVPRSAPPFNISTATPLASTAIIQAALQLLQLNQYQQDLEPYCALLSNPFWGYQHHLRARALSETTLRQREQFTLSTATFRDVVAKSEHAIRDTLPTEEDKETTSAATDDMFTTATPHTNHSQHSLDQLLSEFEKLRRQGRKVTRFKSWAELFDQQLSALNWPGPRKIDSVEYQQVTHWQSVLQQLEELDVVAPPATFQQAFKQLQRLADTTPFQAETNDSPLQILGLLEGAGLSFDYLWIMGMDDRQWPPATEPNSLLPNSLQRELAMPRTSSEEELNLARELLTTYLNTSSEVVLSYSQFSGDAELSPSSLLNDIAIIDKAELLTAIPGATIIEQQLDQKIKLERHDINYAPAIVSNDKAIRGGSAVLKDQASCPFNAFSKWRLGAQQPNSPSSGLSALERGQILHKSLEFFWTDLADQAALMALDEQQLTQRISDCIERVLHYWQVRKTALGQRFFDIEQQRLAAHLKQWLQLEKQRPPFSINKLEGDISAEFEGLSMRLRYDRLDCSHDGKLILIDYKTGSPSLAGWLGERPSEPQMPLYVLLLAPQPECISYAVINADKQAFVGLPIADDLLPGLKAVGRLQLATSWPEQLQQWQHNLSALAREYARGEAHLAVHNKASFSYQGDLLPLNRWNEREQIQRYIDSSETPQ